MKHTFSSSATKLSALALALAMTVTLFTGCGSTASESSGSSSSSDQSSTSSSQGENNVTMSMEGDIYGNGAVGSKGAVSSGSVYASEAGLEILEAGGNAVDAAVATAFAIGVVEPYMSGIGGCGMMNVYMSDTQEYEILEYMETVPLAVEPGWFNPDTDINTAKNAAVPGQVAGLLTALEKYGTMSREEVMAPAIKLAREGFEMEERMANAIMDNYDKFSEEALEIYTNDGIPYNAGDLFKNEALADTLQAISDGGMEAFYTGEIAEKMVEGLQANGSLMAMEDLEIYEAMEREPISTTYHGYEVVTTPPPSSANWLLSMLNIMEHYDLESMGANSAEYLFTFNEACRLAQVDSSAYVGDPAFYDLPIDTIISKEYAEERVALMPTDGKVIADKPPVGDLPVEKLEATAPESLHTTHIAVMDQYGNAVSTTNTLGNMWGCTFMAPGLGFFYNSHINNLDHEDPESPDYVMPGKRVRSTIAPTLVLKDGEPVMAVGSPGSAAISPAVAATINNVLVFGMTVQEAINAPRALAISSGQAILTIEQPMFDEKVVEQLIAYGYELKDVGELNMTVGGVAAVYHNEEDGLFYAGGDPRRSYKALAY